MGPLWPVGQRFRDELVKEESGSSGGYTARSQRSSALGAYQFTRRALQDIKFLDDRGNWTAKSGVASYAEFLASSSAQERALLEYLRRTEQIAKAEGLPDFVGHNILVEKTGESIPVTYDGIVAAAHAVGARRVKQYFEHLADHSRVSNPENFPLADEIRNQFGRAEKRLEKYANIPPLRPFGH
jgi:hypothetical protein